MNDYGPLAAFYDDLTTDVPYERFADYYEAVFQRCGRQVKTVLDMACGTGSMTKLLADRGYEMIAADASAEMLAVAREKTAGCPVAPLLLNQSFEELDLYGTVDAEVCCLDGVNYIEPESLDRALHRLWLFLEPGGVLIFDVNTPEKLRALTEPEAARRALAATLSRWAALTGRLQLDSPSAALNHYVNQWAAYQLIACRLMGRSSIYQCGGAYGFRDQLQDAVNLIALDADAAREQILRCCLRQYAEGDVQHWWHEDGDAQRGLRTRCSDDLLWLPWAVCEYVEKTGDAALGGELLPYLISPPLGEDERDRYEAPAHGDRPENVLRHCRRALALAMDRGRGGHGLLRMGAGDWNDGFDAVGGESVWLTWFFLHVAERFNALCAAHAPALAVPEAFLKALYSAADAAWDGDRYLRGYYADGQPLGGRGCDECAIDSIAQSWAAFCPGADPAKVDAALSSALRLLFDRKARIVKLFDPPFDGRSDPGYITSYGPGFRENGGQYTHAAVWLAQALLRRDRREEAWEVLSALLPGERDPAEYLCEPYVLAADVYTAHGHVGEGGWSWYTGAAGWFLRVVTEEVLGLRLRGGQVQLSPRLPGALRGSTVRYQGKEYRPE